MFISIHADPKMEFPYFLGYEEVKGHAKGEGFNHNFPLPFGTTNEKWFEALEAALKLITSYTPDVLVVSLGMDTFEGDQISEFILKTTDYSPIRKLIS